MLLALFKTFVTRLRGLGRPELPPQPPVSVNPCVPSPCGPYSQCRDIGGTPSCSCLPTFIGAPPNCRPECTINAECASIHACIRQKCQDPCPGSCGLNAECHVITHVPVCNCPQGYTGDPFTNCHPEPQARKLSLLIVLLSKQYQYLFVYLLTCSCSSRTTSTCRPV